MLPSMALPQGTLQAAAPGAGAVLTVEYTDAAGYFWTERVAEESFSAALLSAALDRDSPRLSALVDGWVATGGDKLGWVEAKYLVDRGVPGKLLSEAARRLGRYALAQEITRDVVSVDA